MVKRYEMDVQQRGGMVFEQMKETHDGDYVAYEDYAALEAERDALALKLHEAASIAEKRTTERDALAKDAARYRCLREQVNFIGITEALLYILYEGVRTKSQFDAAIDEEIAEEIMFEDRLHVTVPMDDYNEIREDDQ